MTLPDCIDFEDAVDENPDEYLPTDFEDAVDENPDEYLPTDEEEG